MRGVPPDMPMLDAPTAEWRWVRNGYHGIHELHDHGVLEDLQERYGKHNVTTGNARPNHRDKIGYYIRRKGFERLLFRLRLRA